VLNKDAPLSHTEFLALRNLHVVFHPVVHSLQSVVFSQFTGMLDLVAGAVTEAGLAYVRLDGSTPAKVGTEACTG
jgi:SNF2 family DNA or RNA helicase